MIIALILCSVLVSADLYVTLVMYSQAKKLAAQWLLEAVLAQTMLAELSRTFPPTSEPVPPVVSDPAK